MDISDIKYARSGDLNIAYQRWGTGPERGEHELKGIDGAWRLYELAAH